MNRLKNIVYFFVICFLTGCVKEDRSDCPDEELPNLVLQFEYVDLKQKDIFDERIEKIDVFIFDEDHRFHTYLNIGKKDLMKFRGIKRNIDPGKYYIIAWANIHDLYTSSNVIGQDIQFDNWFLKHIGKETIAPLHYAPDKRGIDKTQLTDYQLYEVNVKPNKITEHTLSFMSAHRTINIYVEGLIPTTDLTAYITGVAAHYDYHLITQHKETLDLKRKITSVSQTDEKLLYTSFYVPHFNNENDIEIGIIGKGERNLNDYIRLSDVLRQQDIIVTDGDDRVIDILFSYENGELIQITLPEWEERPIFPSFD